MKNAKSEKTQHLLDYLMGIHSQAFVLNTTFRLYRALQQTFGQMNEVWVSELGFMEVADRMALVSTFQYESTKNGPTFNRLSQ